MLLCMGVLLQGLDPSIQTDQSFELHVLQRHVSEECSMFLAFLLTLLSFRVLYLNKF